MTPWHLFLYPNTTTAHVGLMNSCSFFLLFLYSSPSKFWWKENFTLMERSFRFQCVVFLCSFFELFYAISQLEPDYFNKLKGRSHRSIRVNFVRVSRSWLRSTNARWDRLMIEIYNPAMDLPRGKQKGVMNMRTSVGKNIIFSFSLFTTSGIKTQIKEKGTVYSL